MTQIGIIIVDHGSRRGESNRMLEEVATLFARRFEQTYSIVEPAHMEIADPSIAAAYARCVERGATRVVVCPFFLGPGKHWTKDIPALTASAADQHPGTTYHVTQPLGIDDLILDLLDKRVQHCTGNAFSCDSCRGTLRSGEPNVERPIEEDHAPSIPCAKCPFQTLPDGRIIDTRVTAGA